MTMFSIAHDIDNDIGLELLAPIRGKLMNEGDCLGVISIDMEHGTIISFADISSIGGGTRETWICSEPNLIIDDNMNGSATSIRNLGDRVCIRAVVRELLKS